MTLFNSKSAPNPAAEFNRGLACPDAGRAFAHFLQAAETGCIRAQFLVGLAYQTGRGVAVNFGRAEAWYHVAAAHGDTHAIANLGVMNLLGQSGPADDLEAYTWIQSAVGLGHHWLSPVLAVLDRRIAGHMAALPLLAPEDPDLRPCTQSRCDYCRCDAA